MSKNKVSDPITDQEMAFALLILSGALSGRQAAQAVGLNPDSADDTKSKPQVRAYMLHHRAVQQQLAQQNAVEQHHRPNLDREQVLNRLWEIAHLRPEMTRGSVTGQVKCLSMIIAMENFIPDPRAVASQQKPAPAAANRPEIYQSAWLRGQQATTPAQEKEDSLSVPVPETAPNSAAEPLPDPAPSRSTFPAPVNPSEAHEPYAPFASVPDLRVPFSIKINPFVRTR